MAKRALAVVGIILVLGTWALWPTDASRIRTRLKEIVEAASAPPGEADFARIARFATIARSLTENVVLDGGEGRAVLQGRNTVLGLATRAASAARPVTIRLSDIDVEIGQDGLHAVALTTATVTEVGESAPRVDVHELRVELEKVGREWLVSRVQRVPALLPPG